MIIFLTQAGLEPRFAAQVCKDDRLFAEKHLPRSILARNIRRATFHDKHFARRQEAFARSILYEVFCENQKQIFRVDFGNRFLQAEFCKQDLQGDFTSRNIFYFGVKIGVSMYHL